MARRWKAMILVYVNQPHPKLEGVDGIDVIQVGKGPDEADKRILASAMEDEAALTGDLTLAKKLVEKSVCVAGWEGTRFTAANIGEALARKDLYAQVRADDLLPNRGRTKKNKIGKKEKSDFKGNLHNLFCKIWGDPKK